MIFVYLSPIWFEELLCFSKTVEEFFLRLGRTDFDQTPSPDDEILNIGANPPDGIGDQAISPVRVKLLDGHHEPHVALLNEVEEFHTIGAILKGDFDHKPEVGRDQLVGGLDVFFLLKADGKVKLLGGAQKGELIDLREIELQGARNNRKIVHGFLISRTIGMNEIGKILALTIDECY